MKFLKYIVVALLSIAGLASSQENLSIGNSAVVENLAKAKTITVQCWAITANAPFKQTYGGLENLKSTVEIVAIINSSIVEIMVKDPLDTIYVSASIKDAGGNELFVSNNSFTLVKSYDYVTKKPKWEPPYYAGNLYFQMMDTRVFVEGSTVAYMLHRNGDMYMLNVWNGFVEIPGWMNSYGSAYFSELVIGDKRYDMNTGSLLGSKLARPMMMNVQFANVERVSLNNQNTAVLNTNVYWGSIPNFEVYATGNRFKVSVVDLRQNWVYPIAIHIATLDDLRPGKKGWTIYPYQTGIEVVTVPNANYFIKVEYQNSDIGLGIEDPPSVPTAVDNGRG